MAVEERPTVTVRISNIPRAAIAKDLFVFACDIVTERKNWKSRGFGRIQLETLDAKFASISLSQQGKLHFKGHNLSVSGSFDDVIFRPVEVRNRVEDGVLHAGVWLKMIPCVCWSVGRVSGLGLCQRGRVLSSGWITMGSVTGWVQFGDVMEACGCCLDGEKPNTVLLKLKHAPKIYQKISGPNIASKFCADRYHICKEDFEFL